MRQVFEVMEPGLLATVQDLGRWGHQQEGVPVSGAMDPLALEVGNLLVGNARGAAALEIGLRGPMLLVRDDALICVCGADLGATLSGESLPLWEGVAAGAGQQIAFTGQRRGVWAYLCVEGGVAVPPVLGSRSTAVRASLGGFEGRPLKRGDVVNAGPARGTQPGQFARAGALRPHKESIAVVRAVPGPQAKMFQAGSLEAFFESVYAVSALADRMGYRLQGAPLGFRDGADILSDSVTAGSVQVPQDGQPIVLMADRQTTGGYAKIATVISVDVRIIAQLPPGSRMRFRRTSVEEAQEAAVRRRRWLDSLAVERGIPQDGASA